MGIKNSLGPPSVTIIRRLPFSTTSPTSRGTKTCKTSVFSKITFEKILFNVFGITLYRRPYTRGDYGVHDANSCFLVILSNDLSHLTVAPKSQQPETSGVSEIGTEELKF